MTTITKGPANALYVTTLKDGDDCEVVLKRYADGSAVLKQGDDIVYVPAQLAAALACLLREG